MIIALILVSAFTVFQDSEPEQMLMAGGLASSSGLINYGDLKFYSDYVLGTEMSSIEWGELEPGDVANVSCIILNTKKESMLLDFYTDNWDPSAAQEFLNLSWNYDGVALDYYEYVEVVFSLSVSIEIKDIESFSFDITVFQVL